MVLLKCNNTKIIDEMSPGQKFEYDIQIFKCRIERCQIKSILDF